MSAKKLLKKSLAAAAVALFWLALWEVASVAVASPVLLPSPIATIGTLFSLAREKEFFLSLLMSILRILGGFAAGVIIGTLTGCLTYRFKALSFLLKPLDAVIKATPVASFIILALVWFKKGTIPSFTSFLIVTPVVWSGIRSALESVGRDLIECAGVFDLTPVQKVKYLYLPSVRIKYFSSLETSLGLAWKAGVAAEVLCTPKLSIGRELYNSKVYLETEKLFAWTFCVIIISLLLELLIKRLLSKTSGGKNEG